MHARRALLVLLLAAGPVAAQQPARQPRATVRGVVLDALHGDPLPNTMVRLMDAKRGVLADSLGRFTFTDVPLGPQLLAAKQYGYGELNVEIEVVEDQSFLQLELQPGPVAIEGFEVVADRLAEMKQRLQNRRNGTATSVRSIDQQRLQRSAARDMLDFLELEANVRPINCSEAWGEQGTTAFGLPGGAAQGWRRAGSCVARRGRVSSPRVFIDEAWAIGGLDQLAMYQPYEFYLVEVYAQGGEIRAYTHNFMERMAGQTMALIPIELWFDRFDR